MVAFYTKRIEDNPQDASAFFNRAWYYEYLHEQAHADADMRHWSAITSTQSPPPTPADLASGKPGNLGPIVNSPSLEGSPILSQDGLELYFASTRPGGYGWQDIWVTKRARVQDPWGPPTNLGPQVNTPAVERPGSISADGLTLYVEAGEPNYSLYTTTCAAKEAPWGPLVNLGPLVNRSGAVHKPVISADDLELYFSVYSGGHMDIWVSRRACPSDPWGVPVSLGPTVNSSALRWLAWLSPDGLTALIWSDRPGGYGSLDTWVTTRRPKAAPGRSPGIWGRPSIRSTLIVWPVYRRMAGGGTSAIMEAYDPAGWAGLTCGKYRWSGSSLSTMARSRERRIEDGRVPR